MNALQEEMTAFFFNYFYLVSYSAATFSRNQHINTLDTITIDVPHFYKLAIRGTLDIPCYAISAFYTRDKHHTRALSLYHSTNRTATPRKSSSSHMPNNAREPFQSHRPHFIHTLKLYHRTNRTATPRELFKPPVHLK